MIKNYLVYGILFCISIAALVLAILAFNKSRGEHYKKEITDRTGFKIYNTRIKNQNIDKLSKPYIENGIVNKKKLFATNKVMNHNIQAENLLLLKDFLDYHNIKFFIDCGTLLGAVRDKGFIKGDHDADISIGKNDIKKLRLLYPELEAKGFISFRNTDGWLSMSLLRKGEYIDFYIHFDYIPFELIEYPFLGTYFPVPKYYEEYLATIYRNWRVPSEQNSMNSEWIIGMPSYVKKRGIQNNSEKKV